MTEKESLQPVEGAQRPGRDRLSVRGELMLALVPTLTILIVLWTLEMVADERVLFSALASSAFLIYLDPLHGMNTMKSLSVSHLSAALVGLGAAGVHGTGYQASGVAMVVTILVMILADVVHPPAIGTALTFAFRSGTTSTLMLFLMALGMVLILALLQRSVQFVFGHLATGDGHGLPDTDSTKPDVR